MPLLLSGGIVLVYIFLTGVHTACLIDQASLPEIAAFIDVEDTFKDMFRTAVN